MLPETSHVADLFITENTFSSGCVCFDAFPSSNPCFSHKYSSKIKYFPNSKRYIVMSWLRVWYLFFRKFFHSFFGAKVDRKICRKFIIKVHCYILNTILRFIFKFFFIQFALGNIVSKIGGHIVVCLLWICCFSFQCYLNHSYKKRKDYWVKLLSKATIVTCRIFLFPKSSQLWFCDPVNLNHIKPRY